MKSRENGMRVWEFRYYEPLADGAGRSLRAATVGTLQQYPSEAAICKSPAVQAIVLRINSQHPLGAGNGFNGRGVDLALRTGGNARPVLNAGFLPVVH